MRQAVVAVCVLVAVTALVACGGSSSPGSGGAESPPVVTTQVVDVVRLDMSVIRNSVLHGDCDPTAPNVCYESFAEQSGEGVTVKDVSCVEAGSRQYECIVQASDVNGDYTVPIAASCDDTGCIWRTQ